MPRQTKNGQDNKGPEKATRKTVAGTREMVWGGFINIRMDDHSKALFEDWLESHALEVWATVDDAICSGLKYGVSYDGANECYIASFTGAGVRGDEARYCLTSRAGTIDEATSLLAFKHVVICDSDWGNYRPSNSTVLNWG